MAIVKRLRDVWLVAPAGEWQHRSAPVQTTKFETVFGKKQKHLDIGNGQEFQRLPLPAIDPYKAHKATVRGVTLNHMPRQTYEGNGADYQR